MMHSITLRHVHWFRVVAQEKSFRKAAEILHTDQSGISRVIKELEERLGIELFARTQRTIRLTPAGEQLQAQSDDLLTSFEHMVRMMRDIDARAGIALRIGIADGLVQPLLSQRFAAWRATVPRTELEISEMRANELAGALRREELDVGFSFGVDEEPTIAQEPAWSYPLVVLVPAGHELAARQELTLPQVVAQPMIMCDPNYKPGVHRQIDELVRSLTDTPNVVDHASSLAGFITKIGSGCGIGLADAGHMLTVNRPDIVSIPLRHETASLTTYVLHKRLSAGVPLVVGQFIAHMKHPQ